MITDKLAYLNYRIVNQHGRDPVVHINRFKEAYDQDVWTFRTVKHLPRRSLPQGRNLKKTRVPPSPKVLLLSQNPDVQSL
jgi:hypothetical protein